MSEVHVHVHTSELAQRKPDPPPPAPLPENPAYVQRWTEAGYTPTPRPVERVRNPVDSSQQLRNYAFLLVLGIAIATGVKGCVESIQAEARSDQIQEMLMFKGVIE